jgi:hypothetical protein
MLQLGNQLAYYAAVVADKGTQSFLDLKSVNCFQWYQASFGAHSLISTPFSKLTLPLLLRYARRGNISLSSGRLDNNSTVLGIEIKFNYALEKTRNR